MNYSLNEIHALAQKSARGAGYSWGMARDAAKAVIWLEQRGMGGCAALLSLLETTGRTAAHCPLHQGTYFADMRPEIHPHLILKNIHSPALFLPFAHAVTRQTGNALNILIGPQTCVISNNGHMLPKFMEIQADIMQADITVDIGQKSPPYTPLSPRVTVDPQVLDRLNAYAGRTYAPATEASRLLGAGAGTTDND